MRSQNLILFIVVCLLCLGGFYGGKINLEQKISLEVLDLFPQNRDRELVDIYRKFGDSKMILIAPDRIDDRSMREFQSFLTQVEHLNNVKSITTKAFFNPDLQDFIIANYFWIGELKKDKPSTREMQQIILERFSQDRLNPIDPLEIIAIPSIYRDLSVSSLPIAIVEMKSADAREVSELYEKFSALAQRYGITHYFSPLFVSIINPQFILEEVNLLGAIAIVFFAILYFAILRMPLLTINTLMTLAFSNLLAIATLLAVYPQVSIISLSFGIGISNICIDYMMHHHFLGYYLNGKARFSSSVFYGFATTIVGFLICLFVPFPLLNQLALYAIINLCVAYLCFAFLYPKITFAQPKYYDFVSKIHFPFIPSWVFLILALGFGIYGASHLKEELDLSKLDYQNQEFNDQKKFFAPFYEHKTFLMQARSIDALIMQAHQIASFDPKSVGALAILPTQKDIVARMKYFKSFAFAEKLERLKQVLYQIRKTHPQLAKMLRNAYKIPSPPPALGLDDLARFGIEVFQQNHEFYTQGSIDDLSKLSGIRGIHTQQAQDLIASITSGIYAPMMSILILAFIAMKLLLLIISGRSALDSLGFIFFPLSCILLYLSLDGLVNLMHLFAMLVVVVMGVDYGVYCIREKDDAKIRHAMLFSTLTTLCSFGFFLFSKTKALNSFGEVIFIGMVCILVMMFFQKNLIAHQKHPKSSPPVITANHD